MPKKEKYHNDFEVDRLTNSIVNCISGDSFPTEVSRLTKDDLKQITKKNGWNFDWRKELEYVDREIYKLTIRNSNSILQGVASMVVREDHVYIHLIENAPFNRGKSKLYEGVAGNIVAFACQLSFQRGFDGYVSFKAKTDLIKHYIETLGAFHYGNHLMVIETDAANKLVEKYFKS